MQGKKAYLEEITSSSIASSNFISDAVLLRAS